MAKKQVKMRAEELWAAACIEAALPGLVADPYDDNSLYRMHDFDLLRGSIRFGAYEETVAADAEVIELWKLVNGNKTRWIEPGLRGDRRSVRTSMPLLSSRRIASSCPR